MSERATRPGPIQAGGARAQRYLLRVAGTTLAGVLIALGPTRASAQGENREHSVSEVVKSSIASVVLIVVSDASGKESKQGSGFIISADGRIATNYHVIEGAKEAIVKLSNGAFFPVDGVLATSKDADLTILQVSGSGLPFLQLAGIKQLSVGDRVVAIGSPLGLEGTVSDGIVSAVRRGASSSTQLIQTTAPASHGNSGGPLLNLEGKVIGVLAVKLVGGDNLNFAVGADSLKQLLASARTQPIPLGSVSQGELPSNLPIPETGPSSAPARQTSRSNGGVLVAGYGFPGSSFEYILLNLEDYLASERVQIANEGSQFHPVTGDQQSLNRLLASLTEAGAGSLLYVRVDHGWSNIHRLDIQCFDAQGKSLWEEKTSSSTSWASTESGAARAAAERMKKKLKSHIGQPGLPLKQ